MVGAGGVRPNMGVRPDAPTTETIVSMTFFEIIHFPVEGNSALTPAIKKSKKEAD
jgi:hypothetical protein